ncbi:MAG: biopolymer transporter ExbD [Planctomycetota bacterium]
MSFATQSRERSAPVLPLAGMVDVLFLLLIFFMTASVFRDAELSMDVSLPTSETASSAVGPQDQVIVTVSPTNEIFLGERQVSADELPALLAQLKSVTAIDSLVVRADQQADWGIGVRIMDVAQQVGLQNVQAATIRPAEE